MVSRVSVIVSQWQHCNKDKLNTQIEKATNPPPVSCCASFTGGSRPGTGEGDAEGEITASSTSNGDE